MAKTQIICQNPLLARFSKKDMLYSQVRKKGCFLCKKETLDEIFG
jgi:hypothetical protein